MANRVKFEFLDNLRKTEEELLSIVQNLSPELTAVDCFTTRSFGLITFVNNNNIQQLFEDEQKQEYAKRKLQPKPQQEYYTNRTLLVGNIRPFIANYPAIELIHNIATQNNGIKVDNIFTIPTRNTYRYTLKITLKNTEDVEKILVEGIRIKDILIEPKYIQTEAR